jgi:hypothetical protein
MILHEIQTFNGVRVIGIAKDFEFINCAVECPKFWSENVNILINPVVRDGKELLDLPDGEWLKFHFEVMFHLSDKYN